MRLPAKKTERPLTPGPSPQGEGSFYRRGRGGFSNSFSAGIGTQKCLGQEAGIGNSSCALSGTFLENPEGLEILGIYLRSASDGPEARLFAPNQTELGAGLLQGPGTNRRWRSASERRAPRPPDALGFEQKSASRRCTPEAAVPLRRGWRRFTVSGPMHHHRDGEAPEARCRRGARSGIGPVATAAAETAKVRAWS